jgi:hypothetical protein
MDNPDTTGDAFVALVMMLTPLVLVFFGVCALLFSYTSTIILDAIKTLTKRVFWDE